MKEKFSVSLMCMDFLNVGEQLNILNDWVGMYHVDIMDGHYCKNITLSPDLVKSFKKVSKVPLDVHLMTNNPEDWIDPVAEAGADIISLHAETINGQAFRLYNRIEELGLSGSLPEPDRPADHHDRGCGLRRTAVYRRNARQDPGGKTAQGRKGIPLSDTDRRVLQVFYV